MRKIVTGLLGCLSLLAVLITSGRASPDKGLSGYGPILGFSLAKQCEKDFSNNFKLGPSQPYGPALVCPERVSILGRRIPDCPSPPSSKEINIHEVDSSVRIGK